MRWKRLGVMAGATAAALVGIAGLGYAFLNTQSGGAMVADIVRHATDGDVSLTGLHGSLPSAPEADAIALRDASGVWLRARNIRLEWTPIAYLLHGRIHVLSASADDIALLRRREKKAPSTGTTPQIDIDALTIARLDVGPAVAGTSVTLNVRGALHYVSDDHMHADITARRMNGDGTYRVNGALDDGVILGTLGVHEPANGLIAGLLGLPALGALQIDARASGSAHGNAVALAIAAGPLRASGQGTIALAEQSADIVFHATAPAMRPRADLAWSALAADGRIQGRFDRPTVAAHLEIDQPTAGGASLAKLVFDATGAGGKVAVKGEADQLHLPGAQADIFAAAPILFTADTDLASPQRPVRFALTHPLLRLRGQATITATPSVTAHVDVPAIAPLAPMLNAQGSASLDVHVTQAGAKTQLDAAGRIAVTGAESMTARLLGKDARFTLAASVAGADIPTATADLSAAGVRAHLAGSLLQGKADAAWTLALPDLPRLVPTLQGNIALTGTIKGPVATAALAATGTGDIATKGFPKQRVTLAFQSQGGASPVAAQLQLRGRFDSAPVTVDAALKRVATTRTIHLAALWRSLRAKGDVVWPGNGDPTGQIALELARLGDLGVVTGMAINGSASGTLQFASARGHAHARVNATLRGLAYDMVKAQQVVLAGDVADWTSKPAPNLHITATGVAAEDFAGNADATASGPLDAIAIALHADLKGPDGRPGHVIAGGTLDGKRRALRLARLDAASYGQTLVLTAPAQIDFANGLAVDRLSARLDQGTLLLAGRLAPSLAATLSVHGLSLDMLKPYLPDIEAQGTLSADADLTGTLSAPSGTVHVMGHGLAVRGISTRAIAPADLDARATLASGTAHLAATLVSGSASRLSLAGTASLAKAGAIDLHVQGGTDLAILDPILTASGQSLHGKIALDMTFVGPRTAPRATGTATLTGGELQDFSRGVHITNIAATLAGDGDRLDLKSLKGEAGEGTIEASGQIGLTGPGHPVDIAIALKNARPMTSDRIAATLDGALALKGNTQTLLTLGGKLKILRGEIDIPEKLPPQVAVIPVRHKGRTPPPPAAPPLRIALDLTLSSPGQLFVRGRGLDAEVEGRVHLGGTTQDPDVGGGFDMRRGTLSLAGQTLDFTTGKVSFAGSGPRGGLDPTLDFVAQTSSANVTATLEITGFASRPQIVLTSTPSLPQDEILARLLFQQSASQLSAIQLAEIGTAVASLGGFGSGFDPVAAIRHSLGLDRLAIGSVQTPGSSQTQTTVEAGKYVARNVYVGARQNLSGGTQAQVQVDITKHLKAQAMLGTGTNATVTQGSQLEDNGSGVGVTYEFEY
ncbi:MAG TPA: translocation/assembly module TamB domain-containing protein [Rhizomicrobium sp.]|jgi:translocation and assembly module TamB